MYLQNLSIIGFRGVGACLDLPLAHRTIIFGPNGSGKSSLLQSIAWTLYGKLPMLSGGVFTKEDALVNDFFEESFAQVTLTLSNGTIAKRQRNKQSSSSRGANPLTLTFEARDPQAALEKQLGLSSEEFYAAVFLHQETIRDFLTTTPEKRSTTIDRMIGTYLLRMLIKLIDPKIPEKAITENRKAIQNIDIGLSNAAVINREILQEKKEQYGDPKIVLPELLDEIQCELAPILSELDLPDPQANLKSIKSSLQDAQQTQLKHVSELVKSNGELLTLQERYQQAVETNWQGLLQQKVQVGDPSTLSGVLESIQERLGPFCRVLGLTQPDSSLVGLENSLSSAHRTQPNIIGQLEQRVAALNALQARYKQAAIVDWLKLEEQKNQVGDPSILPGLLTKIQQDLAPILQSLGLPNPQLTLPSLEQSMERARRAQPGAISNLERRASQLLALKESYLLTMKDVLEVQPIPPELFERQAGLEECLSTRGRELTTLKQRLSDLRAKEEQMRHLRNEVEALPGLLEEIRRIQAELDHIEATSRQGSLYNQVIDVGRQYLEDTKPNHCPVCKQTIKDMDWLLSVLHSETPTDIDKMRREQDEIRQQIMQIQKQRVDLESKSKQLTTLEAELTKFPADLPQQIEYKSGENLKATDDLARVQLEIQHLETRNNRAEENRKRLQTILDEITATLGKSVGANQQAALEQGALTARTQSAALTAIDFQPIVVQLTRARKLYDVQMEEANLHKQLEAVLVEVRTAIFPDNDEEIPQKFSQAVHALREQIVEIQALDFQPIADDLARAERLQQISDEEERLGRIQAATEAEVLQALNLPTGEIDLKAALERTIEKLQARAQQINDLDLQPIKAKVERAERLIEIQQDELRLYELESNYQTAKRQKARLDYRIRRLVDLRDALQDIAQTTIQRQEKIVADILNGLDVNRYYQQLDPHPTYKHLKIEPEQTSIGNYNYWIKALTDDYSHDTYVQTRFSTAQANCAAIAIFLAVNQHLSKNLETLILDDPSQSMDILHKTRLAQTLASNPRQVIVATEDPQTYELLKSTFPSPTIHELQPWTAKGTKLS